MQSILLIRRKVVRLSRTLKYISLVGVIQCIAQRRISTKTWVEKDVKEDGYNMKVISL